MSEVAVGKERRRLSGGFWRRLAAVAIDWIAVAALTSVLGALAYGPTNGLVRVQQAVFMMTYCEPIRVVPTGMGLPADFRIDSAASCRATFLGREVNRFVRVAQSEQSGNLATSKWRAMTIDQAGRVQHRAFFADGLTGLTLFIGLVLLEGFLGTSLGKAAMGLTVAAPDGGKPALRGVLLRNAMLYGGWAFCSLVSVGASLGLHDLGPEAALWITLIGFSLPLLISGGAMILQRPDPFYDHWAGVRVMRR